MHITLKDIKNQNSIGPWLLNEECLLKLDELFDSVYQQLLTFENEKSAASSYLGEFRQIKYVEIVYKSGNKNKYDCFEDAIYDAEHKNDLVISFEYLVAVKYNELQLSVKKNNRNISYLEWFGNISESQIRSRFEHSINKLLQQEWPSFFRQIAHLMGVLSWLILGVILLFELFLSVTTYSINFNNSLKRDIIELVSKTDLTNQELSKLIRCLAAKEFSIDINKVGLDKVYTKNLNSILLYTLIIGAIICLALTISPDSHFGIGRGESKIRKWKKYYHFMFYAFPITILIPIAINLLTNLF